MSAGLSEKMRDRDRNKRTNAQKCYRDCKRERNELDDFPSRQRRLRGDVSVVCAPPVPRYSRSLNKVRINIRLRGRVGVSPPFLRTSDVNKISCLHPNELRPQAPQGLGPFFMQRGAGPAECSPANAKVKPPSGGALGGFCL